MDVQFSSNKFILHKTNLELDETSPLTVDLDKTSFERVRKEPSALWKKIKKSTGFQVAFQSAVGVGTTTGFFALILPASLVLTGISVIGLTALGLSSPIVINPKGAKIWRIFKNKLLGFLSELAVLPKTVLLMPLAFKSNPSSSIKNGKDKIIVLVHGFLDNKTRWIGLSKALQKETKKNNNPITENDIYAINLGEPVTVNTIDTYARFLATKLDQIRKIRNLDQLQVILDCHSMGGLVAAFFVTNFAKLVNVQMLRLIANGTPWHGTPMAKLGSWTKCGKEMVSGHTLQENLQDQIQEISDRIFTISSKGDTVVPYDSARGSKLLIPEENRTTLKYPFGHLAMLDSRQARQKNIQLIKEAWLNPINIIPKEETQN